MKKLFLILSLMIVGFAGIAQEQQVFVTESVTQMRMNHQTKEYDIIRTDYAHIPIVYGPGFMQIGKDSRTKFKLYGDVVKNEDALATYYIQAGFTYEGLRMTTATAYGKQETFIKVMVTLGDDMFIYRLENPYK